MIKQSAFEEILPLWQQLWPTRTSKIESNSAMTLDRKFDSYNMTTQTTFFVWEEDGHIVGVYSGHACSDNSYRSRGIWVDPNYRNKGIASALIGATINQAKKEKCYATWAYPRITTWPIFSRLGFILCSDWEQSETGTNAYCVLKFT